MAPPATNAHRLPDALRPLGRLAHNLLWSWDAEIAAVLAEIGPDAAANPVSALVHAPSAHLEAFAADAGPCGPFRPPRRLTRPPRLLGLPRHPNRAAVASVTCARP